MVYSVYCSLHSHNPLDRAVTYSNKIIPICLVLGVISYLDNPSDLTTQAPYFINILLASFIALQDYVPVSPYPRLTSDGRRVHNPARL